MEECFKCHTPETKAILFDVILPDGIDKICGKCSAGEDLPMIKNKILSEEKTEKKLSVRERLFKISGIKLEEKKPDENLIKVENDLKEIARINFTKNLIHDPNLSKELVDNFHWIVMRARRMKHLTLKELAKAIYELEGVIKKIEEGNVPPRRDIIMKLEEFLNIKIMKHVEDSMQHEKPEQIERTEQKKIYGLDIKNIENLTISDLQEMKRKITKTVVVASGYFDPLHIGHIEYLEKAKKLGDKLIVILNNDEQIKLKKGSAFMPQEERAKVIQALGSVDEVFISIDNDESVCRSLEAIKPDIFAKGGDRYSYEIPENEICKKHGIKIVDGLGKKIQSSSWLIEKSKE